MKSSPFKTTQGGVSKPEETTTKTKQPKKKLVGEKVGEFMTPTNKLEFALSGLGGVGTGAGKWGTKFLTKTKVGRKLVNKIPFVANLLKKQDVVKNQGFKAFGTKGTKGGVAGATTGKQAKLQKYGDWSPTNEKGMQDMLRQKSKNLDEFLKGVKGKTVYNKQNTRYLGKQGGRPVYEVDLPNGEKMKFYESTGWGGKVGSKGKFIPIEGTQTRYYPKGTIRKGKDVSGQPYEWFNKGGSKATYKGKNYKGFEDAGGNYISVKEQLKREGVDIAKALKSGKLKIGESGFDFQYGKGFSDIAKQLENIYPSRL